MQNTLVTKYLFYPKGTKLENETEIMNYIYIIKKLKVYIAG